MTNSQPSQARLLLLGFAATIFVSAFLLFQVQPIISKAILPWFGGSPAVWTTAMLFFQSLLFAGYAYAHFNHDVLRGAAGRIVHGILLVLAMAAVATSILPRPAYKPADGSDPAGRILILLAVTVALPYFVLSATGPLVQAWFSRSFPGRSPYRLYSLSNFGSLLALVTYPFLIEPTLRLSTQAWCWQVGFIVFAVLCAYLALRGSKAGVAEPDAVPSENAIVVTPASGAAVVSASSNANESAAATPAERPGAVRCLLWLFLPAFASLMLLATTNHACQDVAVVPFLFIAPLSLYLLTFIICFDHARWYLPRLFGTLTLLIFVASALYAYQWHNAEHKVDKILIDVGLSFAGMFTVCMLCHGELVRLKPHPRYLTMFYLFVSAGGAIGGLFVSLIAPMIFTSYVEWNIGLIGGCMLAAAIILGTEERGFFRRYPWIFGPGFLIVAGVLCYEVGGLTKDPSVLDMRRNFYGVLKVTYNSVPLGSEGSGDLTLVRSLVNGGILHGMQIVGTMHDGEVTDHSRRTEPTTYYGLKSGVGLAIEFQRAAHSERGIRVGAIGLGTGTLAAYAHPNDKFVFYEINPQVPLLAGKYFTFLHDARERMAKGTGNLEIVMGDARLSLEREVPNAATSTGGPMKFDVIVVDAFSGDAIPTHLLTREAGDIYLRQLAADGVLAVHISNRYLDLEPVVRGLGQHMGWRPLVIHSADDDSHAVKTADWVLLSNNAAEEKKLGPNSAKATDTHSLLWTDDYSDLWHILR